MQKLVVFDLILYIFCVRFWFT